MMNHCESVGVEVLTAVTISLDVMLKDYNASNFRVDKKPSKLPARSRQLPSLVFSLFLFV
jgi:hypothetical protein